MKKAKFTILHKSILLVIIILLIDQIFKIWIKTNMYIGQSFLPLGMDWFQIRFVENEGMAFGWALPGDSGKMFLSIFRIIAIIVIGWYIYTISKKEAHKGLIICMALIFAGAIGNIIDSAFYGMIFSESGMSPKNIATMFPDGGGYAGFLHGKVVDMLYFPLFTVETPSFLQSFFGEEFTFFGPIFNIADSAITVGVFAIIIFHKRFFTKPEQQQIMQENVQEVV